jgi:hypothetical protein
MKKIIAFTLAYLLTFQPCVYAACTWSDGVGTPVSTTGHPTVADVQDCCDTANANQYNGEVTVFIPALTTPTWTTNVEFDARNWTVTKATFKGAGITSTIINGTAAIIFKIPSGITARIKDFKLTGGQTLEMQTQSDDWSVVNVNFYKSDTFYIKGTGSGAIVSPFVISDNPSKKVIIHIEGHYGPPENASDSGNYSWGRPSVIGTRNANVNLEGSTFECDGIQRQIIDGEFGGSYAVRLSNFTKGCGFTSHDALYGRAIRSIEAAYNKLDFTGVDAGTISSAVGFRGGTILMAHNAIINAAAFDVYQRPIVMTNYRSGKYDYDMSGIFNSLADGTAGKGCFGITTSSTGPVRCYTDTDCPSGAQPGGETGACQDIDSNTGGNGYAARDQLGRGANQAPEKSYLWDNTLDGTAKNPWVYDVPGPGTIRQAIVDWVPGDHGGLSWTATYHIVLGRDYEISAKTGWSTPQCPDSRTELTGSCDTATLGVDGYNIEADTTPPTITAFTIPATSISLTVAISSFAASDAVGVTGYCLVETNDSAGCSWAGSAPSTYTFSTQGAKTLYAFAKDAAGNISVMTSTHQIDMDSVTITLPNATIGTGAGVSVNVGAGVSLQ